MVDTLANAMTSLRTAHAGLVMVDVALDVPALMRQLRAERFAVPVLACGIDAPAPCAVAAIRAGARDYVPLPPQPELIAAAITSVIPPATGVLIGNDPRLRQAVNYGRAMAPGRTPVLLCGEAGTGRETTARIIHAASGRPGSFLAVECAGVASDIVEAELFGHDAGAFSGAIARRLGSAEEAADGTLFVRNIDCLPPAAQGKLVAALEDGAVCRLGGTMPFAFTARLIASTSRDLDALVQGGGFRGDLSARLSLVRIALPPLRERLADVPLLAHHFAERLAAREGTALLPFSDDAIALLFRYNWPCNVRELEDVVHRALVLADGPAVGPEAIVLSDGSRIPATAASSTAPDIGALVGRTVEEVERELILQTLQRCQGNRTSASGILGISVRTMRNKLKSFVEAGIPVAPAL